MNLTIVGGSKGCWLARRVQQLTFKRLLVKLRDGRPVKSAVNDQLGIYRNDASGLAQAAAICLQGSFACSVKRNTSLSLDLEIFRAASGIL